MWQVKGTAWPGGISRALCPPGWGQTKLPGGESGPSLGISKEWGPAGNTSSLCCCLVPGTKGAQALSQKGRRVAFPAELLQSRL